MLLTLAWWPLSAVGAEAVCARVKIEIQQELTLERQGFDAVMKINNNLDTVSIDNVAVNVHFRDANGQGVVGTSNTNDPDAEFFIRVDRMDGISDVTGSGRVLPGTTGEIHWLIIPTHNAATSPTGTLYFVGATLTYTIGGVQETVEVTPDFITVKPLPDLALDYFIERDIFGDEPMTPPPQIEPIEPFTLGVRVKNTGQAAANNVGIDSAQPEIRENPQGLLIDFTITGSSVNDQPTVPSLLIDFGNIAANSAKMGRWEMQSTLAGEFIDFTASMSHADELGGATTSIVSDPITHFLVRNVLVDEPGRDPVRDFLATVDTNSTTLRVYESDNTNDEVVTDRSAQASFVQSGQSGAVTTYNLDTSGATAGFMFVKLPDPNGGAKVITDVIRSDGKRLSLHNAWTSKERERGENTVTYHHYINVFDSNSTGRYTVIMAPAGGGPLPPVIQGIPDKTTSELTQVGFVVMAGDPNGDALALSVSPRPVGASFIDNGDGTAFFNWTPAVGQAGVYTLSFTATDGALRASEAVTITVNPEWDTDGDGMDDDWERLHFGSLDRDGAGDFDGDGISDLDEYLSGSDPTATQTADVPVITPAGGTYPDYVQVELATATAGASVYYTLDGSAPDATSHLYSGPIIVSETSEVRAIAVGTGFAPSAVAQASYAITKGGPFQQGVGQPRLLVVEAEHYSAAPPRGVHSWAPDYTLDHTGESAMQAQPDSGGTVALEDSPSLDYRVNFLTTGTHYIWVRGRAPDVEGDTIHIGLDGTLPAGSDNVLLPTTGWAWRRMTADGTPASFAVHNTGEHTLQIWMGEDGAIVDKILLTTDPDYVPSGAGPRESLTNSTNPVPVLQTMADRTGVMGTTISLSVPVADPDGDTLTYSATGLPAGLTLDSSSGAVTGLIDASAALTNAVEVTVNDGGDTVTTAFRWDIVAQDTTVPAVTPPADVTAEATAVETPLTLGTATAVDDVDGTLAVTSDAPAVFPLGVTLVTYSATDSAGNVGSATQRVTVTDTTAPQLSVPANQTVISPEPTAVDIGQATASDIFGPVIVSNNAPAVFPMGVTLVSWTATDANGNASSGQQQITVTPTPPSDTDGDGVPDGSDLCPGTLAGEGVDANGCSASQADSDGDGVTDAHDRCAATNSGDAVDANGCSLSQLDPDGDGAPNTHTVSDPQEMSIVSGYDTSTVVYTLHGDARLTAEIFPYGTAGDTDGDGNPDASSGPSVIDEPGVGGNEFVQLLFGFDQSAPGASCEAHVVFVYQSNSLGVYPIDSQVTGLEQYVSFTRLADRYVVTISDINAFRTLLGVPVSTDVTFGASSYTASAADQQPDDLAPDEGCAAVVLHPLVDGDGDGMPDSWEMVHGLNPGSGADASLDADGDGVTNLQEYLHVTDPRDAASAPVYITSVPPTQGVAGQLIRYTLTASQPGAAFELVQAPSTAQLTVDASGTHFEWTPASQEIGESSISIRPVVSGIPSIAQAFSLVVPANGDMNADNRVDIADVLLMERAILGFAPATAEQVRRADLYPQGAPDGQLTLSDLLVLKGRVLGSQ